METAYLSYTTGEYLLAAKTLNDLVVNTDERALLWKSLRERAERESYYAGKLPDIDLPPETLMKLLGISEQKNEYLSNDSQEEEW